MHSEHQLIKKTALFLVDCFSISISYLLASYLRFGQVAPITNRSIFVFGLLFSVLFDFFTEWNDGFLTRNNTGEVANVFFTNLYLFLAILAYNFAVQNSGSLSRSFVAVFFCLNFLVQDGTRTVLKRIAPKYSALGQGPVRVLMIVEEKNREKVEKQFVSGTGHQVIGQIVIDDHMASGEVDRKMIKSPLKDLAYSLVQYSFDEVFIVTPDYSTEELRNLILDFENMGVTCRYGLDLPDLSNQKKLTIYGNYPVVTYAINRMDPVKLIIKRLGDVLGAIIGLLLCGIIWLFLAPAIKLDSPGPVLFSQIRIGKNGRRFKFYKFRSMYIDAEERKKDLMEKNEVNGLMFKMNDDPRITKVGKFIRKTSLDEFPQFWNVLIGDMSLVGTRPPTEEEFEHYNEHYRRRLSMTPGITGLWQVSGRSDIKDFDEVVKLDLEYIDNWSIGLDIKILLETVGAIFRHKGAE